MGKKFKVTFRGNEAIEFDEGTTFKTISERFRHDYNYDILVAKADNDIVDLSETLKKRCNVDFFDRSSEVGNSVYISSAVFILVVATRNVLGSEAILKTECLK